jgi:hypothetical protein
MRPFLVCALGLVAVGCALTGFEYDPHAVTPGYGRWEAIVPVSADSAYATALAVVVQTGYTLSTASRADRVVTTHVRQVRLGHGLTGRWDNVRFTFAALPAGPDSARISVAGETCGPEASACRAITARYDGRRTGSWQLVRWLGEQTLARLTAERVSLR